MSRSGARLWRVGVVVPVRDEREVLPLFWARLREVRQSLLPWARLHVLFVNDASGDGSGAWLDALCRAEGDVEVVHAPCALGQQRALLVGLAQVLGDAVVTLDADLQDPPELIADMMALWQTGPDVVYGVRAHRPGDSVCKRLSAAAFYRILSWLSPHPIPADAGDFRLMDRRVVQAVLSMPQSRPYVRGMVARAGLRPVACRYARGVRHAGSSSYDLWAMSRLAWAGVFSFAAPWRVAVWGAAAMAAGTAAPALLVGGPWMMAWAVGCAVWGLGCGAALAYVQRRRAPDVWIPTRPTERAA